jgi:1,4-alpha-glucan branching enzyme
MNGCNVIAIVLNAHTPFVRHPELPRSPEERWFFDAVSETYIPLLEVFDRLDKDHIPFKMGIVLSPILCHMLRDEHLLDRYLVHVDRQIEFGREELIRNADAEDYRNLARIFCEDMAAKRSFFTGRCGRDILSIFDYYQKKGRIEILATAATHAFLPFYTKFPEAVQAQLEVAVSSYRGIFGRSPQGFWLPELGWSAGLDSYLRLYNFGYTILETHGAVLGKPFAERGSFYPVKTPAGILVLPRDYHARRDLEESGGFSRDPAYRNHYADAGYELPADMVRPFLEARGIRTQTGYKYWAFGVRGEDKRLYDPRLALEKVREHARSFLEARISRLNQAGALMQEQAVSLCAYNADRFGRFWYEGPQFIEALFREGALRQEVQFMHPAGYLYKQNPASFQTVVPEFSSWGVNGYAEMWLDASNDWMYRHSVRALERMIEIADRFPDDTGLKERALNQAAREILLVQSSDWAGMLYGQEHAEYARNQIEGSLRNFTTIYESLGSNYISTEWLTSLERRHNIFPAINYRIFRRKS